MRLRNALSTKLHWLLHWAVSKPGEPVRICRSRAQCDVRIWSPLEYWRSLDAGERITLTIGLCVCMFVLATGVAYLLHPPPPIDGCPRGDIECEVKPPTAQ